jgi:hypothetical protein
MDLQTSQIDLESIEAIDASRLRFNPNTKQTEIEHLAHAIIQLRGLLRIPVVEALDLDSYRLIAGHFDYYAYLKAREIDGDLPDRLRVFIVNKKNAGPIMQQLDAFDRLELPSESGGAGSQGVSEGASQGIGQSSMLVLQNFVSAELAGMRSQLQEEIRALKADVGALKKAGVTGITSTGSSSLPTDLAQELQEIKALLSSRPKSKSSGSKSKPTLVSLTQEEIYNFDKLSPLEVLSQVQENSSTYAYAWLKIRATKLYSSQPYRVTNVLNRVAQHNQNGNGLTMEDLGGLREKDFSEPNLKKILKLWPEASVEATSQKESLQSAQSSQLPKASTPSPTSSSNPAAIGSYEEFKSVVLEIFDQLDQNYNMNNMVPIYRIRRQIGEQVTRPQFRGWLFEMQSEDILHLLEDSVEDGAPDKIEDSVMTNLGKLRCYVKRP